MTGFHWKLKLAVITLLSVSIAAIFSILLLFSTINHTRLYKEQTRNYCRNFTLQVATDLTNILEKYEDKMDSFIDDPQFRNLLEPSVGFSDATFQFLHLVSDTFKDNSLDGYYLQELDCYLLSTNDCLAYGAKPTDITNVSKSTYYSAAISMPTTLNWLGYNPISDSIELSKIVYDYQTYKPIALIIMRLSPAFFRDTLDKYEKGEIAQIDILTNTGIHIAPSSTLTSTITLSNCYEFSDSGILEEPDKWVFYTKLKDTAAQYPYYKWTVLVSVTKTAIFKSYRETVVLFIVAAVAIALLADLLAIKAAESIIAPIADLADAMNSVKKGQFNVQVQESSHIDEIYGISHGFNTMVLKLDQLINTVYKAQLAEKEAQFKSLKSQIHPHFLFNTLQLIGWKAHEYEADEIGEMISSLSYMLSTNIYIDNDQNYSLKDELEYIRNYILIIQYKYQDKISFRNETDNECLDCHIPKLIIQPFIENAIIHGLAPKSDHGTIKISIFRENEVLNIIISDDGIGIPQYILDALQNDEPLPNSTSDGHHIALKNVRKRIHLLYGSNYGFTIKSRLYQGTTVNITIPFHTVT